MVGRAVAHPAANAGMCISSVELIRDERSQAL
jgi:hypothetical protein